MSHPAVQLIKTTPKPPAKPEQRTTWNTAWTPPEWVLASLALTLRYLAGGANEWTGGVKNDLVRVSRLARCTISLALKKMKGKGRRWIHVKPNGSNRNGSLQVTITFRAAFP